MADVEINWYSVMRKVKDAATPKVRRVINTDLQVLAEKFKTIMHTTIMHSPEMTSRESAVVASTGFEATNIHLISVSFNDSQCIIDAQMDFNFTGDKTLVSLSPGKQVNDMVVMFNNGYSDNNVDPERPPKGFWHGFWLVLQPDYKLGAHFVSKATDEFAQFLRSQGYDVRYLIDGKYT